LWLYWRIGGYANEGLDYLTTLLNRSTKQASGAVQASALVGAAMLAISVGDLLRGEEYCRRCLSLTQQLDEPRTEALSLNVLGIVARSQGQYATAIDLHEQAL